MQSLFMFLWHLYHEILTLFGERVHYWLKKMMPSHSQQTPGHVRTCPRCAPTSSGTPSAPPWGGCCGTVDRSPHSFEAWLCDRKWRLQTDRAATLLLRGGMTCWYGHWVRHHLERGWTAAAWGRPWTCAKPVDTCSCSWRWAEGMWWTGLLANQ